jgi:CxxC motif-containing protein (DUF1111 family)
MITADDVREQFSAGVPPISTPRSVGVPPMSGRRIARIPQTAHGPEGHATTKLRPLVLSTILFIQLLPASPEPAAGGVAINAHGRNAFARPMPKLSRETLRQFSVGNSFFNANWVIAPGVPDSRDGLGPFFHARSCSACHPFDGRGRPPEPGETMTGLLFRLGTPQSAGIPIYGHQLAPRAVPGLDPEGDIATTWTERCEKFPDGTERTLVAPDYAPKDWHYGPPPADLRLSPRLAPPVFGGGLIEAIPDDRLSQRADPDDADHDGISGRVNIVARREPDGSATKTIGRFGWKASVPSLRHQAAAALRDDLGITSRLAPDENYSAAQVERAGAFPRGIEGTSEFEATDKILDRLETYLRTLAPPARRNVDDATVRRGEILFASLRCAHCHLPEMQTGPSPPLSELAEKTFHPYTDVLLHDMGPLLADGRPDGEASGTEWRTAPLWGLGLLETVNGHTRLLHDGRARSAEEAILWHGGEADQSRQAYKALPLADREALLRFLDSL